MSRDARHRTGRDADFRAGRRRRPLLNPRKSGNRPVRTRLLVVLGELVQTTAGKWITHPPTRCPNGHPLGAGKVLVGHQACLGHGGGTPPGPAARAIRRCTGRHSTRTARRSMGLRQCVYPRDTAEASTPSTGSTRLGPNRSHRRLTDCAARILLGRRANCCPVHRTMRGAKSCRCT